MTPKPPGDPVPISKARLRRLLEVDADLAHELRRWVETRQRHIGREQKILRTLASILPEPPEPVELRDAGQMPGERKAS